MYIRSHNMHMYDCVLMVTIYVHRGNNIHRKWRFLFILSVLEQRCELHWNAETPNLNNGNLYSGMGLQDWFSKPVIEWTPNYIVYRRGIQIPNKALGRWEHQVSAGEGALLIVLSKYCCFTIIVSQINYVWFLAVTAISFFLSLSGFTPFLVVKVKTDH